MIRTHGITHFNPDTCFGCRVRTLQLAPTTAFQPHFNYSVGSYVRTESEFKSMLRRRADENSIATGTTHTYEMVDPGVMKEQVPFPEHDDILNTQGRAIAEKYA
jgi:hypothetical protein